MWFLFLFVLTALAEARTPNIHIQKAFKVEGDPRTFIRHVLIPTEDETLGSWESSLWLVNNAMTIRNDARARGYMEGDSYFHYLEELALYEDGRWPSVFITEQSSMRLLHHLCFAQRWDDSPLPWERRFLGDVTGILPKEIESKHQVYLGGSVPHHFHLFPELNERENLPLLLVLATLRPRIAGERTELKFLFGDEEKLVFLRELFRGVREYELHRASFRRPSEENWKEYDEVIEKYRYRDELKRALRTPFHSPRGESITRYFQEHFFDRALQPYVDNSWVYGHISDLARGKQQRSPRLTALERILELPPSEFTFLEGEKSGPPRVRTDIEKLSRALFEQHILLALERDPDLAKINVEYVPGASTAVPSVGCNWWISSLERGLQQALTAATAL